MPASSVLDHRLFGDDVLIKDGRIVVKHAAALASPAMDQLVRVAVFGAGAAREQARWLIWELGQQVGVRPASIHDLYVARGRGRCHGFTVPAINVRMMAYDTARAIFRTAIKLDAGAFVLEIARSEIAYTDQRPAEYVAVMLAAALREGFRGPVFIQGDHFQLNAKKFAVAPEPEVDAVKALAREAVAAVYDAKFEFLFTQLAVGGTAKYVTQFVTAPVQHRPAPQGAESLVPAAPDDADLSD